MKSPTDLPFVIKVCGITNETDARIAIEAGANALGFNFYERSPRHITMKRAHEIMNAVAGEYLKVGIFVNPPAGTAFDESIDVIQLYGEWRPELTGRTVWKATTPDSTEPLSGADAYVMDTPSSALGGSGETFNWTMARGQRRIIIAGGLDASNVAAAIRTAQPWGVDACSRLEVTARKKDPGKVQAFVSAAQRAFRAL